jgi:cholestenol delta-isomerase
MKCLSTTVVILLFGLINHVALTTSFLLCSYAIASRKSYSHILQFAVSLGQLYGCIVYFTTAYLDGFNFWASPFYFWAYFVGANSSWVVIPLLIARRSWKKICAAIHQAEKVKTK